MDIVPPIEPFFVSRATSWYPQAVRLNAKNMAIISLNVTGYETTRGWNVTHALNQSSRTDRPE